MKILQLVTRRQYRGAEVAAATFSEEFIRLGHQVIFAGLYHEPEKPLHVSGALNVDLNADQRFFSIDGYRRLLKLIKREKPDVLHANGSDTLKYLVAVKIFMPSCKVVYRNISVISHWRGNNPLKNMFYNGLFSKVDFVTSVGDTSRNDFVKTLRYPEHRIAVIKRGIRIPDKVGHDTALKKSLGIQADDSVLIHVGNFSPEKNHEFLIQAFAGIRARGVKAVLLLAGDGILKASVENQVHALNLNNDVVFLGLKKDITPYLALSDLILLTSRVEGVPGVLLEAAAQGVPAVALNVGGVGESVRHGETGMLVDGEDLHEFASAVIRLLEQPQERRRLGDNAHQFVKENHDLEQGAKKFLGIFETLVNNT